MIGEGCSVLGSLVSLCTAIAPPAFFLPLASIGNALRSMHYSIWGATHTTFARNFTLHGNVGDLIGKDEAQMSVAHILGAAFGIILIHFNHTPPYLFTAFSVLAPLHILSTVKMLKAAQFEVLNEAKLSLLVRGYIDTGKVPTPEEIHDKEVLFGEWVNTRVGKVPKITPGASLSQVFPPSSPSASHTPPSPTNSNSSTKTPHQTQPLFNTTLQTLKTERYLLSLPHLKQPSRIAIAYKSHSNTEDVVRSLFHAVLFWDQLEQLRIIKDDGGVGREMRISGNDKPRRDVDERMVMESLNNSYKIVNEKWGEFWSLMVKSPWDVDQIYFDDKFTRYNVEHTPAEGAKSSKGNKNEK
ncbi:vitamin B6 photo-protection and homoeostasis-domain-containing protein [Paraphysoderma sedebokerense]|nr:vitamin B6 photo-protection and homoeostasis-domain-containing protein [Paraphysoderma sedebokerense]